MTAGMLALSLIQLATSLHENEVNFAWQKMAPLSIFVSVINEGNDLLTAIDHSRKYRNIP